EIDPWFLPPEQVWRDRDKPLGGQFVTGRADVGVHAKQFLKNDHGRCRQGCRPRDVGAERPIRRLDDDLVFHVFLLMKCIEIDMLPHGAAVHWPTGAAVAASSMSLAASL